MIVLTFNEQLFDAMVRHQIGLLLYSGQVRNEIWRLLDASESDLRHQIIDRLRNEVGKPLLPARLARVRRILEGLRETRLAAWKDANGSWLESMRDLVKAEPNFMVGIMNTTIPVELGLVLPDAERLRAIVTSKPFMGRTLKQWADHIARADVERIQQQIMIGLTQGESVQQMARRVVGTVGLRGADGVTAITRNFASTLVRTATNAMASGARAELMLANADLLTHELFTATLDSRTTPICRSLDGNLYEVGEGPVLPLHFGERSILSPVVDGEVIGERPRRDFTQKQLLREFAEKEGIKAPGSRSRLPHGKRGAFDDFARKRMRELTGIAPAKLSYQEWLKGQSAKFQDDILGVTKGKLFRAGGLSLPKFVAPDGSELSLAKLAKFHKDAFRAAGLDPADFLD